MKIKRNRIESDVSTKLDAWCAVRLTRQVVKTEAGR
jgi:hypothetical protein